MKLALVLFVALTLVVISEAFPMPSEGSDDSVVEGMGEMSLDEVHEDQECGGGDAGTVTGGEGVDGGQGLP